MEINGKRVLVTGASRGLGQAIAFACARSGASEVIAGVRKPQDIEDLRRAGAAENLNLTVIKLDVTSAEDVDAAGLTGRVDILFNNAGTLAFGGVLKASLDDVRSELEVNYLGVLRVVRAFGPAMAEHGDGMIVNIGSILGKVSVPAIGTYCATKAALLSLSQALRGDLGPRGVRVITVLPSTVDTDMSRGFDLPKMTTEDAAKWILEAVRAEAREAAIGDISTVVIARLKTEPEQVEKEFGQFRAD
ncbi:MAG TPA: SDR family NAD(P)-dependent oxidoreductase [Blastocatellia bacterium]|nr:SDR family NAD(P)-dependent oxidoreductase [Blastocatellia bacterium]